MHHPTSFPNAVYGYLQRLNLTCQCIFSFIIGARSKSNRLDTYFESIQPYYPLFRKHDLLYQYYTDQLPQPLLAAIFAVSANLTTNPHVMAQGLGRVGEVYADFVKRACSPILLSDASATITDLRTMFLLALYEFRNNPNRRAWAIMGHLVRLAYQYGIHQVDNPTNCSFYDPETTSADDLESWRYLWWSIFILDTCCNTTVAIPSNIELDSLCTALPTGTISDWTNGEQALSSLDRTFLYDDLEVLSNHLKSITSKWLHGSPESPTVDVNFTIRIINTAQLREICNLCRAVDQNPTRSFTERWQRLSTHTAALRLALPARYLNPLCMASSGESKRSHTLRMVNLLEINISNLLVAMPKSLSKGDVDDIWSANWDASIAYVDRIVEVVKCWDPSMVYFTDPAVGYIIFIAMIMIHIHQKLESTHSGQRETESPNQSSFQLLKLFLQQLGNQWHLPQTLLCTLHSIPHSPKTCCDIDS